MLKLKRNTCVTNWSAIMSTEKNKILTTTWQQSKFDNTAAHVSIISSFLKKFETIYFSLTYFNVKEILDTPKIIHNIWKIFICFYGLQTAVRRNWYSVCVFLNCEIWCLEKQFHGHILNKDSVNVNYPHHSSEFWL